MDDCANNASNKENNNDGEPVKSCTNEKEITIPSIAWTRKSLSYKCSVNSGNDPIKNETLSSAVCVPPVKTPPKVVFSGDCYRCGGSGHSQNYCPKTLCSLCSEYGHSERVCTQPINNNDNRYFNDCGGTYFNYFEPSMIPRSNPFRKNHYEYREFGSGWKKNKQHQYDDKNAALDINSDSINSAIWTRGLWCPDKPKST